MPTEAETKRNWEAFNLWYSSESRTSPKYKAQRGRKRMEKEDMVKFMGYITPEYTMWEVVKAMQANGYGFNHFDDL